MHDFVSTNFRYYPRKLKVIEEFAEPKSKKQLQQILGICNYYRQFVVSHASYIDPFRDLLKGDEWKWADKHRKAYRAMKDNFLRSVVLSHVILNAPFLLQTDANGHGISDVLYQVGKDNNRYIVSLVSRSLTVVEYRYTTTERELLAILYIQ